MWEMYYWKFNFITGQRVTVGKDTGDTSTFLSREAKFWTHQLAPRIAQKHEQCWQVEKSERERGKKTKAF